MVKDLRKSHLMRCCASAMRWIPTDSIHDVAMYIYIYMSVCLYVYMYIHVTVCELYVCVMCVMCVICVMCVCVWLMFT